MKRGNETMPRPRTPLAVAKLTGAIKNHPERFKDRKDPTEGQHVGMPPDNLSDTEKQVWMRSVMQWPWLTIADRSLLFTFCRVTARIEDPAETPPIGLMNLQRSMLSDFGGTPVTRSKVVTGKPDDDDDDDGFAQFGNAGRA